VEGGEGSRGGRRGHLQSNATAKHQMLGTPHRDTHMNTSAIAGTYPMSDVVYGFRPESAWPGVLFQVFLQGPFVQIWQKQKEVSYSLSFEGFSVKAVFYEMESTVSLPVIGTKRYILQCMVPNVATVVGKIPVNLGVHGAGGKTIVQSLFLGFFEYKYEGTFSVCSFDIRWNHDKL
jgi:hypothetical protein